MSAANEVVHICSCGAAYTREAWRALPFCGTQCDEAEHLELRNCTACKSTRALVVYRNPELPVEAA